MINKQALALLAGAFPNFKDQQAQAYGAMLNDIPGPIQMEAVKNVVKTCKFLPSIAEIRDEAKKITLAATGKESNIPEKEWEVVYRAIGTVGYYRIPEFTNKITAKTVKAMSWRLLCGADAIMMPALRSQFIKTFKAIEEQEKTERRMARSIQNGRLKELGQSVLKKLESKEQKRLTAIKG